MKNVSFLSASIGTVPVLFKNLHRTGTICNIIMLNSYGTGSCVVPVINNLVELTLVKNLPNNKNTLP